MELQNKKVLAFDLDKTLCTNPSHISKISDYKKSKPVRTMIKIVNKCYDEGYKIIIYTARGAILAKNNKILKKKLKEITIIQLLEWKISYHKLNMTKIYYDLLIDDKAINTSKVRNKNDLYRLIEKY